MIINPNHFPVWDDPRIPHFFHDRGIAMKRARKVQRERSSREFVWDSKELKRLQETGFDIYGDYGAELESPEYVKRVMMPSV